jgi:ATP phosphoribosyltransferase regulatory subunit
MTHPIPPGTRDVLPEEMRELRAIGGRMREAFEAAGYGEVHTPALEYEEVLLRGDERAAGARYRSFDERGAVLALRSDMTIPIARVVATRYADAEPPLRFSYLAHAWRATERGVGEPREFLQAGIELIGVPGAEGEAEVVALAIEALSAAGLRRHRVGVGDGALYRGLLASFGVAEEAHLPVLEALSRRDLVGLEGQVDALGLSQADRDLLVRLPQLRGGADILSDAPGVEGLQILHGELEKRGVADRVIFDLGLVRELGYYTGSVFEVYDPAVGFTLGGGGRYDELIGRFGRELPAWGLALEV